MTLLLLSVWFTIALVLVASVAMGDQEKAGRQFVCAVLWPLIAALILIGLLWAVLSALVESIPDPKPKV